VAEYAIGPLAGWQNFYVIVGSSGGALIAVQFVVIALIANTSKRANLEAINAFGTPTVVHFGGALTVSAVMSVPWPSPSATSVAVAICGLGGLVYAAIVFRRAHRQTHYKPVSEDWLWYAIMPCGAYVALTFAALFLMTTTQVALFMIGGAALGLLLVGIHNAWDTVTYIVASEANSAATKPE
jgi:hypothetical protein